MKTFSYILSYIITKAEHLTTTEILYFFLCAHGFLSWISALNNNFSLMLNVNTNANVTIVYAGRELIYTRSSVV